MFACVCVCEFVCACTCACGPAEDRVRVMGGAYGAWSQFDRHSGHFTFASYRDPNTVKTLEVSPGQLWANQLPQLDSVGRTVIQFAEIALAGLERSPCHAHSTFMPLPQAFDGAAEFLEALDLSEDALTKAIIGAIGEYDPYQLPDAKGYDHPGVGFYDRGN